MPKPRIVVVGGPNGAGKSTIVPRFLTDVFGVDDFVNADDIARGLSRLRPSQVAIEAGELMLRRIKTLAESSSNFAFETTLSGRSLIRWLTAQKQRGYEIQIAYVWLVDPELAVARVAQRMDEGGHSIDEPTIRRRYLRSLTNFMTSYKNLADRWWVYNNSTSSSSMPKLIARGRGGVVDFVGDEIIWSQMQKQILES